jgi:hypothetical protein
MSTDGYEAATFDDTEMVGDMMRALVGSTPAGVPVWTNGEGGALPLRIVHSRSQAPFRGFAMGKGPSQDTKYGCSNCRWSLPCFAGRAADIPRFVCQHCRSVWVETVTTWEHPAKQIKYRCADDETPVRRRAFLCDACAFGFDPDTVTDE